MKKLPKATTIKKALLAFVITFCTPAFLLNSLQTYMHFGSALGQKAYDAKHPDTLSDTVYKNNNNKE